MAASIAPVRAKRTAPHLAESMLGRQWAIIPERLQAMRAAAEQLLANPSALTAWADAAAPETYIATQRDGIATVRISGPLERSWSFWSWLFGGTSYQLIAADIAWLRDDPSTRAIILEFDTPGGEVGGCAELAEMIRGVNAVKPVVSHAAGCCTSAGYYLASAGRTVIADSAAIVGSIGTCATFVDYSGLEDALGIDVIELVSTQSPRKNTDPTTHEGRADWQRMLDSLAAVFVADVAAYRDVDPDTVLSDFGQGGIFVGQEAIDAGLADALGTHDRIHAALVAELSTLGSALTTDSLRERLMAAKTTSRRTGAPTSATDLRRRVQAEADEPTAPTPTDAPADEPPKADDGEGDETGAVTVIDVRLAGSLTAAWLAEHAPTVAAELRLEGATAERARIGAIQTLGAQVKGLKAEQAIAAAIADPAATVQTLALQLLEGGVLAGAAALQALRADEMELDPPSNADAAHGARSDDDRAVHMILTAGKRR